jgi:murein DD-endopeptidase MepM/ murein hydrolase activator NlpD
MSGMRAPRALARRAAGLVLALCAAGGGAPAAAERPSLFEHYRREIDLRIEESHWRAEDVDRDGLVRALKQHTDAGESPEAVAAWLNGEMPSRWCAFAPIAPTVKGDTQYLLPFDSRINWIVGQGVSGEFSHTGREEFSLDFAMPEGTPILASRRGTVARVVDGFTRCCLPVDRSHQANQVVVLHADGTFASYVHLRRGIPVAPGQSVAAGELVGYSGSTGYSTMPHLHFSVSIRVASKPPQTIPIAFENGTPQGYVPKHWRFYQNRPAATARIGVGVDGRVLVSGQPFPLAGRAPIQLFVGVDGPSGEIVDVTHNAGTRYVALTPWSLRVDGAGRVSFGFQSSQWSPLSELVKTSLAIVTVLYRGSDGREAYFDAWFRFPDAARYLKQAPGKPGGSD